MAVRQLKRYVSWVQNVVRQWKIWLTLANNRAVYKFDYMLEVLVRLLWSRRWKNLTLRRILKKYAA